MVSRNTTTDEIEAQLESSENGINTEIRAMYDGQEYFITPLMNMAQMKSLPMVTSMLSMGAEVNHVISGGKTKGITCLHTAVQQGDVNLAVVKVLLQHGAGADLQDQNGETALMQASSSRPPSWRPRV